MNKDLLFAPVAPAETEESIKWNTAFVEFLKSFHDPKKGENYRRRNRRERHSVKRILYLIAK